MAFGIDDAVAGVTGLINRAIDRIFPDPKQAAEAKVLLAQQEFQPLLEQIRVNVVEAASANIFVAGWRPFVGWVCGAAFAYKFVLQPFFVFLAALCGYQDIAKQLPNLDWTELAAVLFGMLGLSHYRTKEKMGK